MFHSADKFRTKWLQIENDCKSFTHLTFVSNSTHSLKNDHVQTGSVRINDTWIPRWGIPWKMSLFRQ